MARTPIIATRIPPALLDAARARLGRPDATPSEVVREALARLGRVSAESHTPRKTGRPPRRREHAA